MPTSRCGRDRRARCRWSSAGSLARIPTRTTRSGAAHRSTCRSRSPSRTPMFRLPHACPTAPLNSSTPRPSRSPSAPATRWALRSASRSRAPRCRVAFRRYPHLLQPVEEYNGGLIAYSLGNFVFDGFEGTANESGMLFAIFTADGSISWRIEAVTIGWVDFRARTEVGRRPHGLRLWRQRCER